MLYPCHAVGCKWHAAGKSRVIASIKTTQPKAEKASELDLLKENADFADSKKAEYSVAHASPKLGQGAIRLPSMAFSENINDLFNQNELFCFLIKLSKSLLREKRYQP